MHLLTSEFQFKVLISCLAPHFRWNLDFEVYTPCLLISSKVQLSLIWISRCPQGKGSFVAFHFSSYLLSPKVCLGISSSLSFEFFSALKKIILAIRVGMNNLTCHFWKLKELFKFIWMLIEFFAFPSNLKISLGCFEVAAFKS